MIKINGKIEWEEIGEMVDFDSETEYTAWVTGTDAVSYTHLTLPTILLV